MTRKWLNAIRQQMKSNNIHAYVVPSVDPHQSEYVPAMWERRKWLTGFTGSAGDVVITENGAALWTDSRYFIQAEQQLKGSGIELMKMGLPDTPDIKLWLKENLDSGQKVGVDPQLFTHGQFIDFKTYLNEWNLDLIGIDKNLVDTIWKDQPPFPLSPVQVHPIEYAGESVSTKLSKIRKKMKLSNCDLHVLITLDSIAWTFNIRGNDIEYNPVVIAYAIISQEKAWLFTDPAKITDEVRLHLGEEIDILPYHDFEKQLKNLSQVSERIWLDGSSTSQWIVDLIESPEKIVFAETPVTHLKAVKNETEISGMRQAHIRDGVAMVKFLRWLEKESATGTVTEMSAAEQLFKFRAEQEHFRGLSFETISAFGEHGAIVHYSSSPETDVPLRNGIYLIDSGGQYLDGTTDITRTIAIGHPSEEQKDRFTRVLKGHIRLAMAHFPAGTAGKQLDTIAREPLWEIGLNYGHGTGHGIGSYLNVHEGPQAISYYRCTGVPVIPGMITSNEPGYYKAGEYGIRIENLIVARESVTYSSEEFTFYEFETITLCPIDINLIDVALLDSKEREWINAYHRKVYDLLSPHLDGDEIIWLKQATRAI